MLKEMEKAVKNVDRVKDWVRVHKTNFISDRHRKLNFDSLNTKMTDFCNNNKKLPVRISVYNYTNSGDHELYGRVVTSVREIEMRRGQNFELINKRNKCMGHLFVADFKVNMKPFLL